MACRRVKVIRFGVHCQRNKHEKKNYMHNDLSTPSLSTKERLRPWLSMMSSRTINQSRSRSWLQSQSQSQSLSLGHPMYHFPPIFLWYILPVGPLLFTNSL